MHAIFRHDYPLAVEPASTPRLLVQKKTLRDSLPIDMLLSALSFLVVAQSSSEVPQGLMNNHVLYHIIFCTFRRNQPSSFLLNFSTLEVEAEVPTETSLSFYQTVRRHIPEDKNPFRHRRRDLISHIFISQIKAGLLKHGVMSRHVLKLTSVTEELHSFPLTRDKFV